MHYIKQYRETAGLTRDSDLLQPGPFTPKESPTIYQSSKKQPKRPYQASVDIAFEQVDQNQLKEALSSATKNLYGRYDAQSQILTSTRNKEIRRGFPSDDQINKKPMYMNTVSTPLASNRSDALDKENSVQVCGKQESPLKSKQFHNSLNLFAHATALKYNMITARPQVSGTYSFADAETNHSIFKDRSNYIRDVPHGNFATIPHKPADASDDRSLISEQTIQTTTSGRRSRQKRSEARIKSITPGATSQLVYRKVDESEPVSLQINVKGMYCQPPDHDQSNNSTL